MKTCIVRYGALNSIIIVDGDNKAKRELIVDVLDFKYDTIRDHLNHLRKELYLPTDIAFRITSFQLEELKSIWEYADCVTLSL